MKKLGILLLACITALNLWAEKFKIGKFTFETITSTTIGLIEVDQDITNVFLSETIDYEGKTYTITSIGWRAFEGCSSLTSVTIPNSVTSIGSSAFRGTALYNNPANWENGALYIDNCLIKVAEGFVGHFCIKENTRVIAEHAFRYCTSLISVTIPNSVTSIEGGAFYDCESLTSVTIPNSVTSIEGGAFGDCKSLTSVTIPNSVTSIGSEAFDDCESLTSVTIPNSVTSIGRGAFTGTALYNNPANWENWGLYIDDCLIKVDEDFVGHFRIKENTRVLSNGAFWRCSALISVTIPNSVTSIGECAFYDCESLTSVTIPNSVTMIGYDAFYDCESLTSITIPNSVTSIGSSAFRGTALYNNPANWENGALYIDDCLIKVDKDFVGHFRIKENTRVIAEYAFEGCTSLTSVTIPNSVKSIGWRAFSGCYNLTSVTIPNSVTSIGNDAFPWRTQIIRQ